MKYFIWLLFGLISYFGTSQSVDSTRHYQTEYVVVLVIDGPRYSETFGDSMCQYIPNMAHTLAKEGVLFTNFRNNGVTFTNAGHTAITTGVYQRISNSGTQLPDNPSFFNYFLKSTRTDKMDTWVISGKGKLQILANTTDKLWWNEYCPAAYCGPQGNGAAYAGDEQMWPFIQKLFTEQTPKLSLINLLSVDVAAHQNDWKGYLNGIRYCDEKALELWQLIQANPTMKNKTTLFITNDHGRHLNGVRSGFKSHGDNCEGCRKISLLAMGPDFKAGEVIAAPAEQLDISKTIAELLHFCMPTSKGG